TLLKGKNPQIDLRVQAYETSAHNFLKAVSQDYKTRATTRIANERATHAAEMKRTYEENITDVEAEIQQCNSRFSAGTADLQQEQEERKKAAAIQKQLVALRDKCAAIEIQTARCTY
ncbi:hypothetical protein GGX14DRAFT_354373, partial [Mycena pura]